MDWYELNSLSKFGAFIRSRRRALGITQNECAKMIGVSHATMSALENGKCVASATLHKAMHVLGYKVFAVPEDAVIPTKGK